MRPGNGNKGIQASRNADHADPRCQPAGQFTGTSGTVGTASASFKPFQSQLLRLTAAGSPIPHGHPGTRARRAHGAGRPGKKRARRTPIALPAARVLASSRHGALAGHLGSVHRTRCARRKHGRCSDLEGLRRVHGRVSGVGRRALLQPPQPCSARPPRMRPPRARTSTDWGWPSFIACSSSKHNRPQPPTPWRRLRRTPPSTP